MLKLHHMCISSNSNKCCGCLLCKSLLLGAICFSPKISICFFNPLTAGSSGKVEKTD